MSQKSIKKGLTTGQRIYLLEKQIPELARNILIMEHNFQTLLDLYKKDHMAKANDSESLAAKE